MLTPKYDNLFGFESTEIGLLAEFVENDKYGFINDKGDVVIAPQYKYAEGFSDGLAKVKIEVKYGFIDTNNNLVIPAIHTNIGSFSDGKVFVGAKKGYFYLNTKGERIEED